MSPLASHPQALADYFSALLDPAAAPAEQPAAPAVAPAASADNPIAGPPPWTGGPFRCRLVRFGGFALALPEAKIAALLEQVALTPPQAGDPDWLWGYLEWNGERREVVDLAWWVLPPEHRPARPPGGPPAVAIAGNLALAAPPLGESVIVDPAEVRWRSENTRRPWLAGVLSKQSWALLDIEGLAGLMA
jgi:purine-binding chemotaxis protein CheW